MRRFLSAMGRFGRERSGTLRLGRLLRVVAGGRARFFGFDFPDSELFRVREASQRVQDALLLRKAAPRAREAGSSLPSIKNV